MTSIAAKKQVPFLDLRREYLELREDIDAAVSRVFGRGRYILGPELEAFESAFAAYCGSRHAVGVASGTDALYLALRALGVGRGEEVITTPLSAFASVAAIAQTGAVPVFADLDPTTLTLRCDAVVERIGPATRAILVVHLYGCPADAEGLRTIAREHGLWLVEDACQAHGTKLNGQQVGTFGEAGCFSFYPTKNLGAAGDGGIVVTDQDGLADHLRQLRNYGESARFYNPMWGVNSRLDELQAAVLGAKLRHLDRWNQRRRELAENYARRLGHLDLRLPATPPAGEPNFHLFVVRSKNRERLRSFLESRGIETAVHYPRLIYQQPVFEKTLPEHFTGCPVAEQAVSEILSLPLYPQLTEEEQEYVSAALQGFFS